MVGGGPRGAGQGRGGGPRRASYIQGKWLVLPGPWAVGGPSRNQASRSGVEGRVTSRVRVYLNLQDA